MFNHFISIFYGQIAHETTDGESQTFGPAYNYEFLLEVFQLQQQLEQLGQAEGLGLDKICFAPVTQAGSETRLQDCTVQSIFGYFGNEIENVRPNNYLNTLDKCMRYKYFIYFFPALLNYLLNRNPISIECLAPYGGPIEPGIAVGGYPKANASKYRNL